MKHSGCLIVLAVLLLLTPLTASAFYCPNLNYTGAKIIIHPAHQYSLSGTCMLDVPAVGGFVKTHVIEKATVTSDYLNKATELFEVFAEKINGSPIYRTLIIYECDQGDPWLNSATICHITKCEDQTADTVHDCLSNKLNALRPTTRNLIPNQVKYTTPYPDTFYFKAPLANVTLPGSGKTYFGLEMSKLLAAEVKSIIGKSGVWSIQAKLSWTNPNNIGSGGPWPGGTSPLPDSVTLTGTKAGASGGYLLDTSHFQIQGKWKVKACIDDYGISTCTERSFTVAGTSSKLTLPDEAPARAIKDPSAALPRDKSAAESGRGGGFAPVSPDNRKPVTRQSSQAHSAGGVVTNPRLNPQPDVPGVHSVGRLTTPHTPPLQRNSSGTTTPDLPGWRPSTTQPVAPRPAAPAKNVKTPDTRLLRVPTTRTENAPGPPDVPTMRN